MNLVYGRYLDQILGDRFGGKVVPGA